MPKPKRPRPYRAPKEVKLTLKVPLAREEGERAPETIVAVFDDNDDLLDLAPVTRGTTQLTVPGALVGQPVRVLHAPADELVERPTLARLLRNLALEERVLVRPDLRFELPPAIVKRWKRSCCRVRGRVVMKVRLPGGKTQERPLCNARVVICEVDSSFHSIVQTIPNELVYRLRDEWVTALEAAGTGGAPTAGLQAARGGLQRAFQEVGPAREPLIELARARAVETIRDGLLEHAQLIRPFWCDFDWLRPFYSLDCLHTVDVAEDGSFDTEIWYPCYGDHPDLYFRVEQDCHPGGWLTVHAPSVHCNTHWDYCCGTPVKIEVTHPSASPGRSPTPCVFPYVAGDPASVGSWALLPYESGAFAVHAATLSSGKVLIVSGSADGASPSHSRVWNPSTGALTSQPFTQDLFCSGHAQLPDGRVLFAGGGGNSAGDAIRKSLIFDPASETWSEVADMAHTRWYPTLITLPSGGIMASSGYGTGQAKVEVYNAAANTWTTRPASADKTFDTYPSLHVMPDGKVLYTGTRWMGSAGWAAPPPSELFDPIANTWAGVDDHVIPNRTEGFAVLLPPLRPALMEHEQGEAEMPAAPPTLSRVLVVGGGSTEANANQRSAEIIDMADAAPAWRRIADMNFPRTNANGVLLPDGTVLFCSGIDGYKWGPNSATLAAELFDPQAETWTVMASMSVVRQYHSISLLLPDGRVLNAGGVGGPMGDNKSMEVYSPPYLHRGPRPRITAGPGLISHGAVFTVSSPDACRIDRVSLIRLSTITHHTNSDQRYLPLEFHRQGNCDLRVTAPANANLAPPGYYLLFVLDDCGVPSVGRIVCFH